MALAVIMRADQHRDGAGRVEAQLGMLDQAGIRGLDRARDAEPAQKPALFRFGAPLREARIVGELHAVLEILAEVAAVVGVDQRGLVGHGGGRDHVAAPQLGAIDTQFARREIHHGLEHIGGLGAPGAAIGAGQHGVGQDAVDLDMRGRDHVGAGQHPDIVGRRAGAAVGMVIGAEIGVGAGTEADEFAVRIERELGLGDVVAAMLVRQQALATLADPFHRRAGELGGETAENVFGVEPTLHPETAADILGDHADFRLRYLEDVGREKAAELVRALRGAAQGQALVAGVVVGDRAARLHGVGGEPVDHHSVLDDVEGTREGGIGRRLVAGLVHEGEVVRAFVVNRAGARLDRVLERRHGGQHVVVDRDRLGGILGLVQRLGDHEGDRLADIPHRVPGESGLGAGEGGRAVAALARRVGLLGAEPRDGRVVAGERQHHARHAPGGTHVDRADAGMGMG